jgi:predicted pyridoxine 5'-phosphate oxidase superfamily flavin-nucleotide-binding protein
MLTPDMVRIVTEQRLGFVATVDAEGAPSLSPKGTMLVLDDSTIAFGDIRSPGTVRNLARDARLELNFVDPFVRKGYRFKGTARHLSRGSAEFDVLEPRFAAIWPKLTPRFRGIVVVTVARALPLTTPPYDDGVTEAELRQAWTDTFRSLQPGGAFLPAKT